MKIKALLFTLVLAVPTFAMADTKPADKTTEKANDKTSDKSTDKSTDKAKASLSDDDLKVVAHVKHVNDMEIDAGKLAKTNGTAKVKAFGATLVKDHTANNTKLAALAKKKGVTAIPEEMPMNDMEKQDHQKMMDAMAKLKTLKGADFDKEFLPMMIEGHDKTLGEIDTALASVKDADVVTHLKDTKPVVQRHSDTAKDLQKKAVSMK